MLAALARRAATGLAVVAGVVTLTFFLLRLAPGDPVELLLGPTATPAQITAQRHALGFDRPLAAQYAAWLGRFVRGEWGTSIATGRPVRALLAEAVPATVELVGLSRPPHGPASTPRSRWRRSRCSPSRGTGWA